MSAAAEDVLEERRRQIVGEGFTADHDDQHTDRSLVSAAICYAAYYDCFSFLFERSKNGAASYRTALPRPPDDWPKSWAPGWWAPKNPRRDLVRAAALLIAEIERIDRAANNRG